MRRARSPRGLLAASLLVAAGAGLIAYPALVHAGSALRQTRLAAEVRTLLASAPTRPPREAHRISAVRPRAGEPLGSLEVPAIGLDVVVLEGVSDEILRIGPGHLPGTALPGSRDVSVVAAHRDMHFRRLHEVAIDDRVTLRLPSGTLRYRVVGRRIVPPEDRTVSAPRGRPVLRLVTCWPPDAIGPAPSRLVVSAVPIGRARAGDGGPRRPSAGTRAPAVEAARPPVAPVADPRGTASTLPIADHRGSASTLPIAGAVGASVAALSASAAARTRRGLAWWFLPWVAGLGLVMMSLVGALPVARAEPDAPARDAPVHRHLRAGTPRLAGRVVHAAAAIPVTHVGEGLVRCSHATLAPPAMAALLRAQRRLGMRIEITDSWRSREMQALAYARKPGLAAPPGHSLHEVGLAIDVHTGFLAAHPETVAALEATGWGRFDPGREPWHFSYGRLG